MTEKELLLASLREFRDAMVYKLDGLSDAELRMPMTPTGTNLLGLVKHLAGLEYGYLGDSFGRPAPERMSWMDDGSAWDGADMWVAPGESTDDIVGLYQRARTHADETIEALDLDHVGTVAWWAEGRRRRRSPDRAAHDRRDRTARRARRHRPRVARRLRRPASRRPVVPRRRGRLLVA